MKVLACLPVLLLAATSVAAQPIIATAPRGDTESVTVNYADLNLNTENGMARLDGRLRSAARIVCDVRPEQESLVRERATSRCFNVALARGREEGRQLAAAQRSGTVLAAATVLTIVRP